MPEATQDIHDSAALGQRVDALMSDANPPAAPAPSNGSTPASPASPNAAPAEPAPDPLAEAAAVLSQLGDPDPNAPVEPGTEPSAPDHKEPADAAAPAPLNASVEELLNSAEATPAAAAPTPPAPAAASDEDLAKAVEKLIDETGAPGPAEPGAAATPAPATPATDRIESLDAELAGIADDMIAGEFANESEVLSTDAKPELEPAAKAAPPVPEPTPAPEPAPTLAPPPAPPPIVVAPVTGRPSIALRAMWALSSPLRGKPQHVRDAVGWMALVQAFLAVWVAVYILFLRPNEPPLPTAPVPAAEHAAQAKHEEGAGEGGEAKEAKKDKKIHKPTHAPKKKGGEGKEE